MKIRSILFALALGTSALAGQDGLRVERKYVLNDSDTYVMKMQMESAMGDVDLSMNIKETVKKIYDNGDADIESAVSDMTVNVQGHEQKIPGQKPTTTRMNKFGAPVDLKNTKGMGFMRYGSMLGDKPLKVGETVSFDQADPNDPSAHAKGTVKLESIEGGIAKLILSVDTYMPKVDKPMHLDGTSWIDTAAGKLNKFEGKATNLPAGGGAASIASSATFSMERKK